MTAQCPLADHQAASIVDKLPSRFTTLDFICKCPYSGGTANASACSTVAARGSRSVCGRRLSLYQQGVSHRLDKDNSVSPARWTKRDTDTSGTRATEPARRTTTTARSPWDTEMRRHQIWWKQEIAKVEETGVHAGEHRDYLFPDDLWFANILEGYRVEATRALTRHNISRHGFSHHVMSSQVFALNLAAPYFERPNLLTPVIRATLPDIADQVAKVSLIELEYDGGTNYFNEPGARGTNRTSADLAVWWHDKDGLENLLLIEVKFSEQQFGGCSKGRQNGGTCLTNGARLVEVCGSGCPLAADPYERTYWKLIEQTELFTGALATAGPCPFLADGYQLMRNQLLAPNQARQK